MIRIEQLNVYPVKSLSGISLQQATAYRTGLAYDRQWMLVDESGRFVSQRELSCLATIKVQLTDKDLVLSHEGYDFCLIKLDRSVSKVEDSNGNNSKAEKVTIWNDECEGFDEGQKVSDWITRIIQESGDRNAKNFGQIRLVRFAEQKKRTLEDDYIAPLISNTFFADVYPFLIANQSTLDTLNRHLERKGESSIPMSRFRPNIVVSGLKSWSEFQKQDFLNESGKPVFALRKPCERCIVTTVDQLTGTIPSKKEPIHSLVELNPLEHKKGAYFGQNAIALFEDLIELNVGDTFRAI